MAMRATMEEPARLMTLPFASIAHAPSSTLDTSFMDTSFITYERELIRMYVHGMPAATST